MGGKQQQTVGAARTGQVNWMSVEEEGVEGEGGKGEEMVGRNSRKAIPVPLLHVALWS